MGSRNKLWHNLRNNTDKTALSIFRLNSRYQFNLRKRCTLAYQYYLSVFMMVQYFYIQILGSKQINKLLLYCMMGTAVTLLTIALMQFTTFTMVSASILPGPNSATEPAGLPGNITGNTTTISEEIPSINMTGWDSRGKGNTGGTLE
jgi:hypothetical protein